MLKNEDDGSLVELKNGKPISRQTTSYNDVGKFLKIILYQEDGSMEEIRTWQFDKNNRIIEWGYLNPDSSVRYKETSRYDERGNRIEFKGKDKYETFEYNEKGEKISWHFYNTDLTLQIKRVYGYDAFGNKISEKVVSADKEMLTEYKYDAKNRLIELSGGEMNYTTTFEYMEDDTMVCETVFDSNGGIVSKCINEYNEFGELIKETYID
jgi:hypothetical protein